MPKPGMQMMQMNPKDMKVMNDTIRKMSNMRVNMIGKKIMFTGMRMRMMGMSMMNSDDQKERVHLDVEIQVNLL